MSLSAIVLKERPTLTAFAHEAIVIGLNEGWRRCLHGGTFPQEPDLVAALVLDSAPLLYDAFSRIFIRHGIDFSLVSVYCHQTPKVRYEGISRSSCELGDILFVHIHQGSDGLTRHNALLFQAKMSSKQPYRITTGEYHQLMLYTNWPEFEYYRSPPLSGERRTVLPNTPHRGAQYLLIDDRPPSDVNSGLTGFPGTYPIGSCMADQMLSDHNDLATELVDFMIYRTGRAFGSRLTSAIGDGWTKTIWDLLTVSLDKNIIRKNSQLANEPRVVGPLDMLDGLCFAMRTSPRASKAVSMAMGEKEADRLFSRGENPPNGDELSEADSQDMTGISLILLETSEMQG